MASDDRARDAEARDGEGGGTEGGGTEVISPPGTETLLEGSIRHEKHPEVTPQNPSDFPKKIEAESEGDDGGLLDKAKHVVEEMDRDIGGEYQRREDPTAPSPLPEE